MDKDEIMKNRIRNILVECRKSRDLTQTDVGEIVGKSKTAVASWEQGLSMPDVITLWHLANYYGVSIEYMYGIETGDNNDN